MDGVHTGLSFSTNSTPNRVWSEGDAQGVAVYHALGDSANEQAGLLALEQLTEVDPIGWTAKGLD